MKKQYDQDDTDWVMRSFLVDGEEGPAIVLDERWGKEDWVLSEHSVDCKEEEDDSTEETTDTK